MTKRLRIVMTGGHHSSALPVIAKLKEKYPSIQISWFGHKHSLLGDKNTTLEYREITGLGIPFYNLLAGKLYKTYNLWRLIKVPLGFFHALILLIKVRPRVVMSFGGYLAAPTALAAWILGIPVVTHEQTIVVGYANKLISKFSDKVLTAWPQEVTGLHGKNLYHVGLPIREDIFSISSNTFDVNPNLPTLYITAGKSGSHLLNQIILDCLGSLLGVCNVIHQCGDYSAVNDFEDLQSRYENLPKRNQGRYFLKKFIYKDEIGEAYGKATLVLCRGGAHTMGELIALNKPAIVVPIPWVSHNEQNKNAQMLQKLGLVEILEQKNLDAKSLLSLLNTMLINRTAYSLNDKDFGAQIIDNASGNIVNELDAYLSTK